MKRVDFLKTGTLAALAPFCQPLFAMNKDEIIDEAMMQRMISLNDKQVGNLLESVQEGKLSFSRKTAYEFSILDRKSVV